MARVVSIVLLLAAVAVHAQPALPGQPPTAAPPSAPTGSQPTGTPPTGSQPTGSPPTGAPPTGVPPTATAPAPTGAQPTYRPPPNAVPLSPTPVGVMANRWAVAVGLGLASMTPKVDGGVSAGLVSFELSGRFRPVRPIELGLSFGGATAGNITSSSVFLDFRYRFWAERPFNIFAGASLGVAAAYDKTNSTDITKRGRGALRFIGGVEWRFDTLALTADVRLFGVGENPDVPTGGPLTSGDLLARYGIGGAAFVLGATYYF